MSPSEGAASGSAEGTSSPGRLRSALLVLVMLGTVGLAAELLLLEHTDAFLQWLPLAVLGAVLVSGVAVWIRPGRAAVRVFQAMMLVVFLTGAIGVVLHLQSNVEFELEMNPTLRGRALLWQSLKGAVPALAPGALAQLGLVGLVFTLGHPALRRASPGGAVRADATRTM